MGYAFVRVPAEVEEVLRKIQPPSEGMAPPHITLIHWQGELPEQAARHVESILRGFNPTRIQVLGATSFSLGKKGIPIVVLVDSPDLFNYHCILKEYLDIVKEITVSCGYTYTPHITLAYSPYPIHPTELAPLTWVATQFEMVNNAPTGEQRD